MKILFVVNKLNKTSIPLEVANKIRKMDTNDSIRIISFYDEKKKNYDYNDLDVIFCGWKNHRLNAIRVLKNEINDGNYDIIHTHHVLSGSITRWMLKRRKKTKVIHTVHANHSSYTFKQNIIVGLTLKYCDAIICNSKETYNGLLKWQKKLIKDKRIEIIYNGVDLELINSITVEKEEICSQYGIDKNKYIFVMVGRMVKVKNHINVIKAYQKLVSLNDNYKKTQLVIIGDGDQRTKIEEYIINDNELQKNVELLGTISREEVFKILHIADVFIMASFYEGFCNALVEARAVGMTAIVSRINIFKELGIVDENQMFDPYSVDDICESMKTCYDNANNDKRTVRSVMEKVKQKYSIQTNVSNYLKLYYDVKGKEND